MSISKNNCLYEHATLVGAVQDATLKKIITKLVLLMSQKVEKKIWGTISSHLT